MRLWPFRKRQRTEHRQVVDYAPDIETLAILKHHSLRALLGAFADRHVQCRSPHLFCGDIEDKSRGVFQVVAEVALQRDPEGRYVIGIYLTRAEFRPPSGYEEPQSPFDYVAFLAPADPLPSRKLVIQPMSDGTYIAQCGHIANPVEGDYSTGMLDRNMDVRTIYCNPEPPHTDWQYWESRVTEGQVVMPRYKCAVIGPYWVVADADEQRGMVSEVAHLRVASDPQHNFGIHDPKNRGIYVSNPETELGRTVAENLEPLGPRFDIEK